MLTFMFTLCDGQGAVGRAVLYLDKSCYLYISVHLQSNLLMWSPLLRDYLS